MMLLISEINIVMRDEFYRIGESEMVNEIDRREALWREHC